MLSRRDALSFVQSAHGASHDERYSRSNQDVPRKRDLGIPPNVKYRGQSHEHSRDSAEGCRFAVQSTEKKQAQQAAKRQRGDREPGFEQWTPAHKSEAH